MAIYTSNYLKNVSARKNLNESARMFSQTRAKSSFDIFLSHSFIDREIIYGLYYELEAMGYSVYVDWIVDPHLDRKNVTKESAALVQKRLRSSRSLLLAISTNSTLSKWIPWELGYVDGHTSNCAIIPISDSLYAPSSFKGVEYLSLYPFISKVNDLNNIQRLWAVEDADRYILFENWIKGQKPFLRQTKIF